MPLGGQPSGEAGIPVPFRGREERPGQLSILTSGHHRCAFRPGRTVASGIAIVAQRTSRPHSPPPPLAQPLARVAARAEHTGPRRERLTTELERHRMVGRKLARSHRVRLAVPARTGPTVGRDVRLDRPLRQPSPRRCPPHRVVGCATEAVGEARATAAVERCSFVVGQPQALAWCSQPRQAQTRERAIDHRQALTTIASVPSGSLTA